VNAATIQSGVVTSHEQGNVASGSTVASYEHYTIQNIFVISCEYQYSTQSITV